MTESLEDKNTTWWDEAIEMDPYLPSVLIQGYDDLREYIAVTGEIEDWDAKRIHFARLVFAIRESFIPRASRYVGHLLSLQTNFPDEKIRSIPLAMRSAKMDTLAHGTQEFRQLILHHIIPARRDIDAYLKSQEVIATIEGKYAHRDISKVYPQAYGPMLRLMYRRVLADMLPMNIDDREYMGKAYHEYVDGVNREMNDFYWDKEVDPTGEATLQVSLQEQYEVGEHFATENMKTIKALELP